MDECRQCANISEMNCLDREGMEKFALEDIKRHEEWDYLFDGRGHVYNFDGSTRTVEEAIEEIVEGRAIMLAEMAWRIQYKNSKLDNY